MFMKLLVTTSYSVLELNINNGKTHRIHHGDGLYYGLTRGDQNIYVAARKRMVSSVISPENERGEILIFDADLKLKDRLQAPFPLRDMHQIAWHDRKLWVTCSYDNMVAIWDGDNWEQWFPQSETLDGPHDIHHYNSLFFERDQVWLLAHNRGQSELLSFSLRDRSLTQRIMLGNQAHNIWRESGQLFTCSSADGMILGDRGFAFETGGFPRGYAFNGSEHYVGLSELAERKLRDLTNGRVQIYDKKWKLKNAITLEKEGLVLDVLILHNDESSKDGQARWIHKIMSQFKIKKSL